MPQVVITAIGPDKPGLVGEFTRPIFAAGANVADSRMVNLRGQFAILLLVEGADSVLTAVRESLPRAAEAIGLRVTFTTQADGALQKSGVPYKLKTYSMDQPGIVHRVSTLLQQHHVNIESLQTRLESGAFMGSPLFTMELHITVPPTVQVKGLRREIDALADTLNCEIDLEPA